VSTDLLMTPDRPLARRGLSDRWQSHGPHWGAWHGGDEAGMEVAGGARPTDASGSVSYGEDQAGRGADDPGDR
jgi:hypothetical protein